MSPSPTAILNRRASGPPVQCPHLSVGCHGVCPNLGKGKPIYRKNSTKHILALHRGCDCKYRSQMRIQEVQTEDGQDEDGDELMTAEEEAAAAAAAGLDGNGAQLTDEFRRLLYTKRKADSPLPNLQVKEEGDSTAQEGATAAATLTAPTMTQPHHLMDARKRVKTVLVKTSSSPPRNQPKTERTVTLSMKKWRNVELKMLTMEERQVQVIQVLDSLLTLLQQHNLLQPAMRDQLHTMLSASTASTAAAAAAALASANEKDDDEQTANSGPASTNPAAAPQQAAGHAASLNIVFPPPPPPPPPPSLAAASPSSAPAVSLVPPPNLPPPPPPPPLYASSAASSLQHMLPTAPSPLQHPHNMPPPPPPPPGLSSPAPPPLPTAPNQTISHSPAPLPPPPPPPPPASSVVPLSLLDDGALSTHAPKQLTDVSVLPLVNGHAQLLQPQLQSAQPVPVEQPQSYVKQESVA